ncbi:MAG: MerR family transcriptional regulator [Candidatus Nanopelagicales bacterium]
MSAMMEESGRASLTIGEVLSLLTPDFPEVTISKIRFLESEGLVSPHRAKSGYRRFSADDIDQLRLVLTAQRDRYLPLRVIKDHLAAGTLREAVRPQPQVEIAALPDPPEDRARTTDVDPNAYFSRSELAEASGLTPDQLQALIEVKVIVADEAHRFTGADVQYCRAYATLTSFGVDPRHMRQARNAASRDAHLIGTAMAHLSGEARTDAAARMLDALSDAHYWQVRAELHRQSPTSGHRPRRTTR